MNLNKGNTFNSAAASYDDDFTLSEIGKRQRDRVFHWLEKSKVLQTSKRVFEINCGTGYDAQTFHEMGLKVVATDASAEMIKVSKSKRDKKIDFYTLNFNNISIDDKVSDSDFVFSNFGGLNCLSEKKLGMFFDDLALKQNKGDQLAVVIMPKHCVIEDLYLLFKGQFSEIGRRSREAHLNVDVNGEEIKTFYHSPRTVKQLLFNNYSVKLVKPIAHFLPPSYLEPFFKKKKWLLGYLNGMERIFGRLNFLASNADHFIVIAKRK